MSRDYSLDTYTKQLRNRIIASGLKTNPGRSLVSSDVALQAISGATPIYATSLTGNMTVRAPCNCNPLILGRPPIKDMAYIIYTSEFDPVMYQSVLFPGMADFINENIVAGDKQDSNRLIASYWQELGDDIFNWWGYFFLYDPSFGNYYFPLFEPLNQSDGIMTTQTFQPFGRSFTIIHGWAAEGIYKLDISVADNDTFRFGAYGNMGFDNHGGVEDMSTVAPFGTLYYHHTRDNEQMPIEQLFTYIIPKNPVQNVSKPYMANRVDDNTSIVTNELTSGVVIYFSKSNDTRRWIIEDYLANA